MIELDRARTLGEIVRDAILLYRARWATFLAIGFVVVLPVYGAVFGLGLGEFWAPYDDHMSQGRVFLEGGVIVGVIVPLMTMMVARALTSPSLSTGATIQAGLELFVPAVLVMVVVMASIFAGLLAFVVPGIYLGVRLAFAVLSVALDDARGLDAMRRSWALTAPDLWRPLGLLVVVYVATALAGQIVLQLFALLADAANAQGLVVVGDIIGDAITLPAGLIGVTLLYTDLRARQAPA